MFKRIYLETSFLRQIGWPGPSQAIDRLVEMASVFKVTLLLPEPVEIELEENWIREIREARWKLQKQLAGFSRSISAVGMSTIVLPLPGDEEAMASYRTRVREIKEKWPLGSVPFTRQDVRKFFEMAAKRELPFEEKDKGFRDVVILYSVIDHLRETPAVIAVLAAQDSVFSGEEVARQIREAGVRLDVYRTADEMIDETRKDIAARVRESWERLEMSALETLKRRLPNLQKFISENLEVPEDLFEVSFSGGVTVRRIEVVKVKRVRTPYPTEHPESGTTTISADVDLRVYYLTQAFRPIPRRSLKVGDTSTGLLTGLNLADIVPTEVEKTLECMVEVEGQASVKNFSYEDVEFKSVKFQRSGHSGLLTEILRRGPSKDA